MANKPHQPKKPRSKAADQQGQAKKASPRKRTDWWNKTSNSNKVLIGIAVVTIAATGVDSCRDRQEARRMHRPIVTHHRAPVMTGAFSCDAKTGRWETGPISYAMRNSGELIALNVTYFPQLQLRGITGSEDTRRVDDATCSNRIDIPVARLQLPPNGERYPSWTGHTGAQAPFDGNSAIQLHIIQCTYYTNDIGTEYGTCDTYRLARPDGNMTITCDGTPVSGVFSSAPTGHCAK
jgi:hypothetical protein